MTVPVNDRRIQYIATVGQTIFPYDFRVFANTDIIIEQSVALTGATNILTLTTDYSLTNVGIAGGGDVVFVVGAAVGDIITVIGNTAISRSTDFNQAGDFLASEVNDQFDRVYQVLQQSNVNNSRAFSLKNTDPSVVVELPVQSARVDKFLAFDAQGVPKTVALGAGGGSSVFGIWGDLGVTTGTVNTYVATPIDPVLILASGQRFTIQFNISNTGAVTLDVSGLGAQPLMKYSPNSGTPLPLMNGELLVGKKYDIIRDIANDKYIVLDRLTLGTPSLQPVQILSVYDTASTISFLGGVFTFDDNSGTVAIGAMIKDFTAWVSGAGGGLDTGAAAVGWYHTFAIYNPSTGISDYLYSLSATAPTLPAGYTNKYRIRGASFYITSIGPVSIIGFVHSGKQMRLLSGGAATGRTALATVYQQSNPFSSNLIDIGTPAGIKVRPYMQVYFNNDGSVALTRATFPEIRLAFAEASIEITNGYYVTSPLSVVEPAFSANTTFGVQSQNITNILYTDTSSRLLINIYNTVAPATAFPSSLFIDTNVPAWNDDFGL